jgi:hypothetical protein
MTKILPFITVLIGLFTACKTSSESLYHNIEDFAWNEDTVMSYQFALRKGSRFTYMISEADANGKITQVTYHGRIRSTDNVMLLLYEGGECPARMTDRLLYEVSGNYLIQDFKDGSPRQFMRIVPKYLR